MAKTNYSYEKRQKELAKKKKKDEKKQRKQEKTTVPGHEDETLIPPVTNSSVNNFRPDLSTSHHTLCHGSSPFGFHNEETP